MANLYVNATTVAFAGVAPLALIWNAHRRTAPPSEHYRAARRLFGTLALAPGGDAAPWIRAVVLVPPDTPCAHLSDGMCGIHATKPLRCRTMPFHANLPADGQEPHLKPKPGWPCYNPPGGEAVYDRGRFLSATYRAAHHAETRALAADATILKRHAEQTIASGGGGFLRLVAQVAATPGGYLVVPWSRVLPLLLDAGNDREGLLGAITAQAAVLTDWLDRPIPESYRSHYRTLLDDLDALRASWTSDHVAA